jgi:glutaredoxin
MNAEVITLTDGRVVEGTIIENRDDYITVKSQNSEKTIRRNKIDKIEAKAGSGNITMPITPVVQDQSTKKVKLYMTTWCPYCRRMEQFLIASKIPYKRMDVENNAAAMEDYKEYGINGVPFVVVNEDIITGYDPQGVKEAWDQWNKK